MNIDKEWCEIDDNVGKQHLDCYNWKEILKSRNLNYEIASELIINGWEEEDQTAMIERIAYIKQNITDDYNDSIIDIGCGNGFLLSKLEKKQKFGIDLCQRNIDDGIKKYLDVKFTCDDFETMYIDGKYDIVMTCCSQYVDNKEKFIEKLISITNKKLLILDLNDHNYINQIQIVRKNKFPIPITFNKNIFENIKCKKIKIENCNYKNYRFNNIKFNVIIDI